MEVWKDVPNYEGLYQVSSFGRVRSLPRKHSPTIRIMKLMVNSRGYLVIILSKYGVKKGFKLHRLIAEAFIPNSYSKPQVNHIDGDKRNNSLSNLEWCTSSENIRHAFDTGLKFACKGEDHGRSTLTRDQAEEIKYEHKDLSVIQIAELYGITRGAIYHIRKGRTWSHI